MKISKTQAEILEKAKKTIAILREYKDYTDFLIIAKQTSKILSRPRRAVMARGITRKYGKLKVRTSGRVWKKHITPPSTNK